VKKKRKEKRKLVPQGKKKSLWKTVYLEPKRGGGKRGEGTKERRLTKKGKLDQGPRDVEESAATDGKKKTWKCGEVADVGGEELRLTRTN